MFGYVELLLAFLLLFDLLLVCSSRMLHCIRLIAFQGIVIALFPFAMVHLESRSPNFQIVFIVILSLVVKALLLPWMLRNAMKKAKVQRELEPFLGYSLSLMVFLAAAFISFFCCRKYNFLPSGIPQLSSPVSFITIFTGLFIIVSRRKALTQILGFLCFENGMTMFGLGMMLEYGLVVELGILFDVFALVFVTGIAVFNINKAFSHINVEQLHLLNDDEQCGIGGEK